jgi:succinoglycan biosynthesis transport protein ExoP
MSDEQTTRLEGKTISLQTVISTILRHGGTIVLVTVVVTGSALGFSLMQAPTYQASVKILVGQKGTNTPNGALSGNVSGLQDLTLTVANGADTLPVAQAAVEKLDAPKQSAGEVLGNTSAEAEPGTMFVDISYTGSNPREAQLTANAIGQALSEKVSEVSLGANVITATVWAPATLPQHPVSPNPLRNTLTALVLGTILGVALAFLLDHAKGFGALINEARRAATDFDDSEL